MTPAGGNWKETLRQRLAGSRRIAVIGIGDELSPVDRPGMLAARAIADLRLPGLKVFLAGTVPETMTGPVRTCRPDHILLLDAAEMGKPPGTAAVLDPGVPGAGLFSTHALPLPVVMDYLEKETGAAVTLLGIQPDMAWVQEGILTGQRDPYAGAIADLTGILRDVRKDIPDPMQASSG